MAPTTLSIGTAANRIIGTLRKEAQAAAGNDVLTATEQKKLSPWAASTAAALRKEEGKVTVDGFVDAIAPKVRRALAAISDDGKNVTRKDIADVRVDDLRSRVATLFGTPASVEGTMAKLKKAADAANKDDEMSNAGKYISLSTQYGSPYEILGNSMGFDIHEWSPSELVEHIESIYGIDTGKSAVKGFADDLREEASDYEADDRPELSKHMKAVADQVEGAFSPTSQFKKVMYGAHYIEEDGDTESHVLLAQKKNGAWLVLEYANSPW